MRNSLTILVLIILAFAGYFIVHNKPPDPLALNPRDIQVQSNLTNKTGNVIWLNLEGVRPDHIGAYGYENNITPALDSIAGESLLFERCYAQSTETYRSMATMLTADYPACYVGSNRENVGMGFRDLVSTPEYSLVSQVQNAGHTTCAIVSSRLLKGEFGFDEGFDYYNDEFVKDDDGSLRVRTTSETWEAADAWLSKNFRRPFFLMVHFPNHQDLTMLIKCSMTRQWIPPFMRITEFFPFRKMIIIHLTRYLRIMESREIPLL